MFFGLAVVETGEELLSSSPISAATPMVTRPERNKVSRDEQSNSFFEKRPYSTNKGNPAGILPMMMANMTVNTLAVTSCHDCGAQMQSIQ
jgi:hypothetical protein